MKKSLKILGLTLILSCFSAIGQTRPFPVENGYLRNDFNANTNKITNLQAIAFSSSGSNIVIDASTFLSLFEGVSKKLINPNQETEFLIISNARPYVITSNGIREVTLQNDTSFIRQHEPDAYVSNITVYSTLMLNEDSGIDSNDYSLTYSALTNGNIRVLRAEDIIFGGHTLTRQEMINFTWSNSVSVDMTVTNAAYTSENQLCFNEWTYLVTDEGKYKTGKIFFGISDSISEGSKLIGNPVETVFGSDLEMQDRTVDISCYGHQIEIITKGKGFWYFYGFRRGINP